MSKSGDVGADFPFTGPKNGLGSLVVVPGLDDFACAIEDTIGVVAIND